MCFVIPAIGKSPKEIITSYTAFSGRMKSLPDWLNKGAVVGMQGGTDVVLQLLSHIKQVVGSGDDVAGFWLQDWTGQRNFSSSATDIKRVGLWWNWEVHVKKFFKINSVMYFKGGCHSLSRLEKFHSKVAG